MVLLLGIEQVEVAIYDLSWSKNKGQSWNNTASLGAVLKKRR